MKHVTRAIVAILLLSAALFAECENRLFTISANNKGASAEDIINRLSEECQFSVVVKDGNNSETILKKPLQNVFLKDATIEEVFQLVLGENGLEYEYDNQKLKIHYLITKTFEVDILNTSRTGTSSTNIAITGERVSGESTTTNSDSGGNSKAEIKSDDGYSFWSDTLVQELSDIATRPEDEFSDVKIVINKGAGLITVTGNKKQVARVDEYLKSINTRLKTQVLIDVNILSVKHTNSKSIGIDWSSIMDSVNVLTATQDYSFTKTKEITGITDDTKTYTKNLSLGTLSNLPMSDIVNFLRGYGDVTTVSNPKVMTLNNQPSLISVGNIFYYEETDVTTTSGTSTTNVATDVTYTPLFVGILLDITPSIYNDEIMLKINPSITKTTNSNIDTGTAFTSGPPNLESKQLSSVVKLKDGERAVLGGLISRDRQNDEKKVPLLGDIPLVGYAFKREELYDQLSEMVIIITPHVVGNKELSLRDLGYTKEKIESAMDYYEE